MARPLVRPGPSRRGRPRPRCPSRPSNDPRPFSISSPAAFAAHLHLEWHDKGRIAPDDLYLFASRIRTPLHPPLRDISLVEISIPEPGEVATAELAHQVHKVLARDQAVGVLGIVGETINRIEKDLVSHQPAQSVEHPRALVIDVAVVGIRRGQICAGHQRPLVGDPRAQFVHVIEIAVQPERVVDVHRLGIGRKPFVDPEVSPVSGGDLVAPPLVGHFMQQQVVEPIAVVGEESAVGDQRLVLHSVVRSVGNGELVVEERELAETTTQNFQDPRHLLPRRLRVRLVLANRPEDQRFVERAVDSGVGDLDGNVGGDIDRHQVIVDGIVNPPFRRRRSVAVVRQTEESAIGQRHQFGRRGEGDVHPLVGLV